MKSTSMVTTSVPGQGLELKNPAAKEMAEGKKIREESRAPKLAVGVGGSVRGMYEKLEALDEP